MIPERTDRERSGRGQLHSMIFISLLFHAALLSLLFFAPSLPSPKLTFGPAYTVALVSAPVKPQEQKGLEAGAKELMRAGRSETVQKRRIEAEPVIPIRSLESGKKQDRTLEKAMEEIRKRAAAADPAPKAPAKGPANTKAAPEEKAGTAAPMPAGDTDMNAKLHVYYAAIWSRIKRGWVLPLGILREDALETVIDVRILRSGAVTDVNFEKRSGNRFFDESAMKAIRKATPFPPLPPELGESSLAVGIRFHSSEFKP